MTARRLAIPARAWTLALLRLAACAVLAAAGQGALGQNTACTGSFPNLITDVCYDCMFPMRFGGGLLNFGVSGDDYDTGAGSAAVCLCANTLSVGTPIGFWEPRYMVDVTNTPGCMPLLGGIDISPPYNASEFGGVATTNAIVGGTNRAAFMQANEYINPVMSAIGAVTASPCLDNRSFDVPYVSWADPSWNDDALSLMLTPYAYPFAGIPEIAAEMPDAIAATTGLPLEALFWVAGAWGPMYPLDGNVAAAGTPCTPPAPSRPPPATTRCTAAARWACRS
jgi:conjugal transfer pilus assembly protein TraU